MTSSEHIAALFEGKVPDKPPLMHIGFSSRAASHILGREAYVGGGIQQWREACALWNGPDAHREFIERSRQDAVDIAFACDHDMLRTEYWRDSRKPSRKMDDYTFRYDMPDGSWEVKRYDPPTELYNTIIRAPQSEPTLEDIPAAVESAEKAVVKYAPTEDSFPEIQFMLKKINGRMAIRGLGLGLYIPMEPVWLIGALVEPALIGRYLDVQVKRSLKNIETLARMGLKYLFGGGDFATNQGPVYSPAVFHDLMLPRLKVISDECKRRGVYHLFGSDGNVWPVADDLYGASGVAGHYEFDRRAGMDHIEVNAKFPSLIMAGNISSHVLHLGTPQDVEREVRECLDGARTTNKVITGCSNFILSETPPENIEAMMKSIAKYR